MQTTTCPSSVSRDLFLLVHFVSLRARRTDKHEVRSLRFRFRYRICHPALISGIRIVFLLDCLLPLRGKILKPSNSPPEPSGGFLQSDNFSIGFLRSILRRCEELESRTGREVFVFSNKMCAVHVSFFLFSLFCSLCSDSCFNFFHFKEGMVFVTSDWARIYFMSFYIVTMVSQLVFAL